MCAFKVLSTFHPFVFQIFIDPSADAEASFVPFELKCTEVTSLLCAGSVARSFPLLISQIIIDLSALPDAAMELSKFTLTAFTSSECPVRE